MIDEDKYIHGMNWIEDPDLFSERGNYRYYQYDLIKDYIGKEILEVGGGNRSFTNIICKRNKNIDRLLSIEPSSTFYNSNKIAFNFPEYVEFKFIDLFDLEIKEEERFDTVIFIHVLEHIENDKEALKKACSIINPGGYILIEVPALQFLYSVHDKMVGHFRRYNKKSLRSIIDMSNLEIVNLWYQDPIGILGSFLYFKMKKIKLKSDAGEKLVRTEGNIYDKFVIPFEKQIERYVTFPFGLSLTAILKKK
jgi:2-polyprenyl-3-methyl-5-hydroxy-6-metoxy-1,4-benzoquinol methylase